jgi:alpha-tubulin suppressor-like RCC1 family protein
MFLNRMHIHPQTAGRLHTCALITGGVVKCWGLNTNGQLGYGDADLRYTTVPGGVSINSGILTPPLSPKGKKEGGKTDTET